MFDLTRDLHEESKKIEELARTKYKIDFFDVEFLLVPSKFLNQIASHIGFPSRYRHWTHGLEYEKLKQRYDWGLGKIYELVINNDPAYAYLMQNNSLMEQKLVMAHVFGHSAVFKTNVYFSSTRKNMIDVIANNASKIDRFYRQYGTDEVEAFLDACISIENHIDGFAPFIKREDQQMNLQADDVEPVPPKILCDEHLDMFINPQKDLDKKKADMIEKLKKKPGFPARPQKDLLLFLLQNAPLKKWQEEILAIIREESYYFNPQRQTKILNEGFASYFHFRMMTEDILDGADVVDFSLDHSGTLRRSPYTMNPYYMGFTLLRDIEDRYNRGRFGPRYESCTNDYQKTNWNEPGTDGYQKLMEIMAIDNDYSLIDKYFTEDFCEKHEFYKYEFNQKSKVYEVGSRDFGAIKNQILDQLSNTGIPYIVVVDGNFGNRNELLLLHKHEFDLNLQFAYDTLKNISFIWKRPVHLITMYEDEYKILSYGGDSTLSEQALKEHAEDLYKSHHARL